MKKVNTLIVICGATASGKTDISIQLSNYLDIEVISADSRQIYKLLNIGTAKPSFEELQKVKHHFIDCINIDDDYSAGTFGEQAYDIYLDIINRNKIPVVVGGSGLYIKALCEGLFNDNSNKNSQIRFDLEKELQRLGIDELYERLGKIDKTSYSLYSDKNPRRIIRALEYCMQTGITLSEAQKLYTVQRNISPIYFAIDLPREELYNRINKRTHVMWESGLVNEMQNIFDAGYLKDLNALNTVGYKETIKFLEGEFSKDKAIEEIQKNTRHYAKRQLTWFRKIPNIHFISREKIINTILAI